jgi:hypothetical protein
MNVRCILRPELAVCIPLPASPPGDCRAQIILMRRLQCLTPGPQKKQCFVPELHSLARERTQGRDQLGEDLNAGPRGAAF